MNGADDRQGGRGPVEKAHMFQEFPVSGRGRSVRIQHIVFPTDPRTTLVYLRAEAIDPGLTITPQNEPRWKRRAILVHERTAVSLDAVFNQLPEAYWLAYTQATGFRFSAVVGGIGEVQVWRRHPSGRDEMVSTQRFDTPAAGAESAAVDIEVPAPFERTTGAGLLFIKIGASRSPVVLTEGCWSALGVIAAPVRLVAGYCTFKREEQVLANVRKVVEAPEIRDVLARLVVVDQGRSSELAENLDALAKQPGGDVLSVIQQDNFGGAGGFTRVMLEALGTEGATHVLLMDDDAIVETESIFRTAAFLSLTSDVAVGGQMLDLLVPDQVTETGAWFRPEQMGMEANCPPKNTSRSDVLTTYASVARTEYNGWWFFAVPLSVVRAVGLPLPLFIRCDDVEYGKRLARRGIPTVSLPGIGVWHEPFYVKESNLLAFHERRNRFILVALHYQVTGKALARCFLISAMRNLLAYRYDAAALDYAATTQWLDGPEAIAEQPRAHQAWLPKAARLVQQRSIAAADTVPAMADFVSIEQLMAFVTPLRGWAFWRAGIPAVVRGLIGRRPRPAGPALPALPAIARSCQIWWAVQSYPEVAFRGNPAVVQVTGDDSCVALTHSASAFRWLLPRLLITYARLRWRADACVAHWRDGAAQFHSEAFWKRYLGLAESPAGSRTRSEQAKDHVRGIDATVRDSIVAGVPRMTEKTIG
jgi:galactofuranosylgalactofuranosylrhamnosyl-N-acetylglucosaminyl-diphospho-decaprenol beta-1,5/1,6-galactofuranosyltransferase